MLVGAALGAGRSGARSVPAPWSSGVSSGVCPGRYSGRANRWS